MSETYGPTAERDLVYISHLAVSPSAQGLGLGRAMVSMVLDRAREQGEDVILFTALERTVSPVRFSSRAILYHHIIIIGLATSACLLFFSLDIRLVS